jgi:hypothetical protein
MNWKTLIKGLTIVNLLGWLLIELWSARYADSNIKIGSGWMIAIQLLGYYIAVVGSNSPKKEPVIKTVKTVPITPENCPNHDWQLSVEGYGQNEDCVICKASRRKEGK